MGFHSLVVDAGHTRYKLAHCLQTDRHPLPQVIDSIAALYGTQVDWPQVADWFAEAQPRAVLVTGTNSRKVDDLLAEWPAFLPPPRPVKQKTDLPLEIDVDFPEKVGIDRLLNGIAANHVRSPRQSAILIDTGTAITVDVVDEQGVFRGGAILPGILLGAQSLHEQTTTLPHVNVWDLLKQEPPVLGKNTEAAIASGLYWGHLGGVRELISRYQALLRPTGEEPLVLITGGAGGILAPYLPQARLEPQLSLQGLALVAQQWTRAS